MRIATQDASALLTQVMAKLGYGSEDIPPIVDAGGGDYRAH